MVTGIRKFREHFAAHESQYAIIGGAACDLLFNAAGLDFRATKDIDMVLCVEVVDAAFGRTFGAFLDAGGYQARERSDGVREFYRFHRPTDQSFPFMIELFARRPGNLDLPEDARLARIPVDEDIVSLSAILLDENYFEALQAARRQIDGIRRAVQPKRGGQSSPQGVWADFMMNAASSALPCLTGHCSTAPPAALV